MRICEIFYSIAGESTDAGRPCVFIRFTGCNLRCNWCDTKYSYREGKDLEIDRIVAEASSYGCKFICLTGGEPLMRNLKALVRSLQRESFEIQIETNGSKPIYEHPNSSLGVRWVMDMKCPSSGESGKMNFDNLSTLTEKDDLKFVVADEKDFEWATSIVNTYKPKCQILFSPVWGQIDLEHLVELVKDYSVEQPLLNIRMQLQMHKIIWDPTEREV